MERYDVAVIGGGPAGLAAALKSEECGAKTLLIEREARLGGILKQCIHDGFGLVRFGEKLSGPEYAARFTARFPESGVCVRLLTFVTRIEKRDDGFVLSLVSRAGVDDVSVGRLVLATGCRERTARQIGVHGGRGAGVFTAGSAQYYTNILGELPTRRCVILGSGDIGLIMARRLTLEGATVVGVYEAKPTPSGLTRNIVQCLDDFGIPLYTAKTVTRVFGDARITGVEISDVDESMRPIPGTEQAVDCDALILSVGLIPENELAESLQVPMDQKTKGAVCDQSLETLTDGVYACGNALHVNDLVDYVSESGETAGQSAAQAIKRTAPRAFVSVEAGKEFLSVVPQRIDISGPQPVVFYFRAAAERGVSELTVRYGDAVLLTKRYASLRPPEMERLSLDLSGAGLCEGGALSFTLTDAPAVKTQGESQSEGNA